MGTEALMHKPIGVTHWKHALNHSHFYGDEANHSTIMENTTV